MQRLVLAAAVVVVVVGLGFLALQRVGGGASEPPPASSVAARPPRLPGNPAERRRAGGPPPSSSGGGAGAATLGGSRAAGREARDLALPAADDPRRRAVGEPGPPPHDELRFSLPLNGAVDPDTGATPTQASGLVMHGNEVEFTDDAQLTVPAAGLVDGQAGTISFELKPKWGGADETNNALLQIRDEEATANTLQIVKENNALRFVIHDENGVESYINAYIDYWQPGDAHRVTATWGEAQMTLYLDGQLIAAETVPWGLSFQDTTPIHIGSDFPGGMYGGAAGVIRNLQIYDRALTAQEVRHQ